MGRKRVSSKDVAKLAGVSQATVSYVLNNTPGIKIRDETREAVMEAVKELNYHTNYMARGMRMRKAVSIGVVTNRSLSDHVSMNVLEGIRQSLSSKGFSLTLCENHPGGISESEVVRYYHSNIIDGVIFAYASISEDDRKYLEESNIPYVIIHGLHTDVGGYEVHADMDKAMNDGISCFVTSGRERIGYISENAGSEESRRYCMFKNALELHNMTVKEQYLCKTSGKYSALFDDFDAYFKRVESDMPNAIVCDTVAVGFSFMRYCAKNGIKIPETISIFTIGTSIYSDRIFPSMSAIESPLVEMGARGAEVLFDIMENKLQSKSSVVLDWKFVRRESC